MAQLKPILRPAARSGAGQTTFAVMLSRVRLRLLAV
jgi:hypothetical protein